MGQTSAALSLSAYRIAVGSQAYGLGDALAVCSGGRVIATASLGQKIWSSDQGFEPVPGVRPQVTCVEPPFVSPRWAAVVGQVARFSDGTVIADGGSTRITSRGDLLVANQSARLIFRNVDTNAQIDRTGGGLGLLAAAITIDGGVAIANANSLTLYSGPSWSMTSVAVTSGGTALALGNIIGGTDEEIIATAVGSTRVRIYNSSLTILDEVVGPAGTTSFGSSIVVQPNADGGLGALLIGEPSANRVWRYEGGTLRALNLTLEMGQGTFGAALAVAGPDTVYVGDPTFGSGLSQGAIYRIDGPIPVLGTTGSTCLSTADCPPCATACIGFECVVTDPTTCPSGQVCAAMGCVPVLMVSDAGFMSDAGTLPQDAGVPDAGPRDAGTGDAGSADAGVDGGPVDAGPVDAGPVDAGPADAGPVDAGQSDAGAVDAGGVDAGSIDAGRDLRPTAFTNSGCTSSPGAIFAALCVLLVRRKRGPGAGEQKPRRGASR